jgi:chromosome segregation ATPase
MKMKITLLCLLCFLSILYIRGICLAEDDNKIGDVNIPPEMETVKRGDVNVMVPKGVQLVKQGDVTMIEDTDIYAARNFAAAEDRFKNLEKEIEAQKNEINNLKEVIYKMWQEKDAHK